MLNTTEPTRILTIFNQGAAWGLVVKVRDWDLEVQALL